MTAMSLFRVMEHHLTVKNLFQKKEKDFPFFQAQKFISNSTHSWNIRKLCLKTLV